MTSVPEHLEGYYNQQKFRLSYGIHEWYHELEDHTFPTSFIDLTHDTIKALLACNKVEGKLDNLKAEEKITIVALKNELDSKIVEFSDAFIKLDSRSPKDTLFKSADHQPTRNNVIHGMTSDLQKHNQKVSANSQFLLDTFMKNLYQAMKVTTGEEALFLLCGSERVREDLQQVEKLSEYGLSNRICIRKWDSYVAANPQLEFRAFVYKGKLNAISQYDHMSYYPYLIENKERIKTEIISFFNQHLKPIFHNKYANYIVDFFVGDKDWKREVKSGKEIERVVVVELNSFESWTGACLFSWNLDREILLNEKEDKEVEMRLVEVPQKVNIEDYIPSIWLEIVLEECKEYLIVEENNTVVIENNNSNNKSGSSRNCNLM